MKSVARRLLEKFNRKDESNKGNFDINYFADHIEDFLDGKDNQPKPYNIVAIRNGREIVKTKLYDVDVDSLVKSIDDATHGINIDDPISSSWWKHIDALQAFAGKDDTPCLTWHRNESSDCLAALDKLKSSTHTGSSLSKEIISYVSRGALKK